MHACSVSADGEISSLINDSCVFLVESVEGSMQVVGVFLLLLFVQTLSCCGCLWPERVWWQQSVPASKECPYENTIQFQAQRFRMRFLVAVLQRVLEEYLGYKGSLRSVWALLVHYSCIRFERGQDWQELIAWWYTFICLFDVQIMFSYYFALWRPVMPPAFSPGLWLVLRLLLVQCVVWLHHPCTMDITFLALLLLLIGCWAPVQVKPLVSEPCLILIVQLFVSRIID